MGHSPFPNFSRWAAAVTLVVLRLFGGYAIWLERPLALPLWVPRRGFFFTTAGPPSAVPLSARPLTTLPPSESLLHPGKGCPVVLKPGRGVAGALTVPCPPAAGESGAWIVLLPSLPLLLEPLSLLSWSDSFSFIALNFAKLLAILRAILAVLLGWYFCTSLSPSWLYKVSNFCCKILVSNLLYRCVALSDVFSEVAGK